MKGRAGFGGRLIRGKARVGAALHRDRVGMRCAGERSSSGDSGKRAGSATDGLAALAPPPAAKTLRTRQVASEAPRPSGK